MTDSDPMLASLAVSRRLLLAGGGAASLAGLIGQRVSAAVPASPALAHTFDGLTPPTAPSQRSHDAYVLEAAARALLLSGVPDAKLFPMGDFAPGVEIGPIGKAGPCMVIRYRFAPNAVLPAHNHPNYSVATIGISGHVIVRQFEPQGTLPAFDSKDAFAVRLTSERSLKAGRVATLSPLRDNIHTFQAGPDGAEYFDVTSQHGPDIGFSYLQFEGSQALGKPVTSRWWKP